VPRELYVRFDRWGSETKNKHCAGRWPLAAGRRTGLEQTQIQVSIHFQFEFNLEVSVSDQRVVDKARHISKELETCRKEL
jgi:hypothetical protein